jgi:TPP-dependent trihydroxycyclohexane-1,2-dione (THcHDO) dehydratase
LWAVAHRVRREPLLSWWHDQDVSDHLLERVHAWGVERVFGYPGDGINGIVGAFDRMGGAVQFVQARHEELAAFMATAHAKFTGEVGVCLATQGPGAIHLLNGLHDAKLDHQPVVAIIGQQARTALGGDYQQEVDLLNLFKDVASEYVQMITAPGQVRHVVDRAFRIARDRHLRLRFRGRLVRPRRQAAARDDGVGVGQPWPAWAAACLMRSPPSSPIRAARWWR